MGGARVPVLVGCTCCTIIPIAMIVVASMNMENCPVQPEIPPFLLSMGILWVLSTLIAWFLNGKSSCCSTVIAIFWLLLNAALLAVLIAESYYVYRVYVPDYEPDSGDIYCDQTLYLLVFIFITILYAAIVLGLYAIGRSVFGKTEKGDDAASEFFDFVVDVIEAAACGGED